MACQVSSETYTSDFSLGARRRPAFFPAGFVIRFDVIGAQSGPARSPVAGMAAGNWFTKSDANQCHRCGGFGDTAAVATREWATMGVWAGNN